MFKSIFIASFLLLSAPSFAKTHDQDLTIKDVVVYQVPTPLEVRDDFSRIELPTNPISEIAMYLDGLIAIGKKIWPIIKAGQPVITTSGLMPSISVLPKLDGAVVPKAELFEMANWSEPKVVSYRVSYRNWYQGEVIGFTYTVFFQHSGDYQGVGKYITSLKVQASEVKAAWGFNFDASSELINVANVGSKDAPVASAIIQINYNGKGPINSIPKSNSFYVDGNGTIKALNN